MKKFLKNAAAVVAMAAAVIVTVPALAKAGTAPEKGCGVNPTGYHDYRYYCIGFESTETYTHKYYANPLELITGASTCTYTLAYHGSREQCQYCKRSTGVQARHCDNEFHKNCSQGNVDHGYCNGLGSDVTIITQQ